MITRLKIDVDWTTDQADETIYFLKTLLAEISVCYGDEIYRKYNADPKRNAFMEAQLSLDLGSNYDPDPY